MTGPDLSEPPVGAYLARPRRLPRLVGAGQVAAARRECDRLHASAVGRASPHDDFNFESKAGGFHTQCQNAPHLGVLRKIQNVTRHSSVLAAMAEEARILAALEDVMDRAPVLDGSVLWFKPPQVGTAKPWHQDAAYLASPTRRWTVWIALDDADAANGCLEFAYLAGPPRVLAHTGLEPSIQVGRAPTELCEAPAGHGLLFSDLAVHRSQHNHSSTWRRALLLRYVEGADDAAGN